MLGPLQVKSMPFLRVSPEPPEHPIYTIELIIEILQDMERQPMLEEGGTKAVFTNAVRRAVDRQSEVEDERRDAAIELLEEAWDARNNKTTSVDISLKVDIACMKAHALLTEETPMNFRFSLWGIAGERAEEKCKRKSPSWHRRIQRINFRFPVILYYNSVRLRVAFCGFMTSVLVLAYQAGILIETFMSVFTPLIHSEGSSILYGYFAFLPVIVCWGAFFLEGILELSMDAADGVPLVKFQAAFLQGLKFLTWPRFLIILSWLSSAGASVAESYLYNPYFATGESVFSRYPLMICKLSFVLLVPLTILKILTCCNGPKTWEDIKSKSTEALCSWEPTEALCSWACAVRFRSVLSILYVIFVVFAPAVCSSSEHLFYSGPLGFVLIMSHNDREDPKYHFPFKWERRTVDIVGFLLLEIFPFLNGIRGAVLMHNAPDGRGWPGAFFRALVWGAIFSVMIGAIILQTSTVFIVRNSSKDRFRGSFCCVPSRSASSSSPAAPLFGRPAEQAQGMWSREYYKRWSVLFRKKGVAPGMLSHMHRKLFEAIKDEPDLTKHAQSVAQHFHQHHERKTRTPFWNSILVVTSFSISAYILYRCGSEKVYIFHWLSAMWFCAIEAFIFRSAYVLYQFCADTHDCLSSKRILQFVADYLFLFLLFVLPKLLTPYWPRAEAFSLEHVKQAEFIVCTWILTSIMLLLRDFRDTMPVQIRYILQMEIHPNIRLVACWFAWGLALFLADMNVFEYNMFFLCPTFLLTAFVTSFWFSTEFPGSVGRVYWFVSFGFYLMFAALLIGANFKLGPFEAAITVSQTVKHSSYLRDYVNVKRDASYQYGLCELRYGDEGAQLSALDLAQLAGLTYEKKCENMEKLMKLSFSGTQLRASLPNCSDYQDFPRYAVFDIHNSGDKGNSSRSATRVIAFKGTSEMQDLYTDAMFYSAIKVLQWTHWFFPAIYLLGVAQMQWFFYVGHLPSQSRVERSFWSELEQKITKFTNEGVSIILTGHSLGGAFAQVMAARLNLPALVFSSPGVLYSADRFGIHDRKFWGKWANDKHDTWNKHHQGNNFGVQVLKSRVRNVIPRFDEVPLVDEQLCLVEHINCREKAEQFGSPLSCHSLKKTACELWRVCGDPHNRVHDCSKFFEAETINHWMIPDDYK